MQDIILDLIGSYTPVTYLNSDGIEIIPDGFAGVDWSFIIAGAFSIAFVVCLFKILGVLLKK